MNKKRWLLISFPGHPSCDAEDGRQQGEDEIPYNQAWQESVFTKAFGGAAIEDQLGDVAQKEQEHQYGEVVSCVMCLGGQ